MTIMGIARHNVGGQNIVGDFEAIVARGDTDGDVMGDPQHPLRYRYHFEVYRNLNPDGDDDRYVLVCEFHNDDAIDGAYRFADHFSGRRAIEEYLRGFDPTSRLPPEVSEQDAVGVRARYEARLRRFLAQFAGQLEH